jgi:hypothetical protein
MAADLGNALSPDERDRFLARDITTRLACLDDRSWPYAVPVWHQWDGERFWIIASRHAKWVSYLQRSPAVALVIDEPETVTRVLCQGTARYVEGPSVEGRWVPIALQMAERYLGADQIETYQRNTAGMERWLFAIDVDRLLSWRGAGLTN